MKSGGCKEARIQEDAEENCSKEEDCDEEDGGKTSDQEEGDVEKNCQETCEEISGKESQAHASKEGEEIKLLR